MTTKRGGAAGGDKGFSSLLGRLVQVPKEELLAEERKYEAAKRRRQQKPKKKR